MHFQKFSCTHLLAPLATAVMAGLAAPAFAASCDHACLEKIGDEYRAAYVKHDPSLAPIAKKVKYSENNVMLKFPDGSWDTVTEDLGPALTFSDPVTGGVGIYTAVMQRKTPGYLAIRLKVVNGKITEIEHVLVTKRYAGVSPTVFGDVTKYQQDPDMARMLKPSERISRAAMVVAANGYFNTLEHNDGTLKTKFGPNCQRHENGGGWGETAAPPAPATGTAPAPASARSGGLFGGGPETQNCWYGFTQGFYAFNNRVRDRDYAVIDEEKGLVMARGYIDHKGVMDKVHLVNGTETPSAFQEPQTWAFLETFKIENGGELGPIDSDFTQSPYYIPSVWPNSHPRPDPTPDIPDYR